MKRNRYLLCFLICGLLLYFAVPRISLTAGGREGLFAMAWLLLALLAAAGNLTGILYTPGRHGTKRRLPESEGIPKKMRSFHR